MKDLLSFVFLRTKRRGDVCQSSVCPDPVRFPALSQIKPHAPRSCGALPSIPSSFTRACILPPEGKVLDISAVSACLTRALHMLRKMQDKPNYQTSTGYKYMAIGCLDMCLHLTVKFERKARIIRCTPNS